MLGYIIAILVLFIVILIGFFIFFSGQKHEEVQSQAKQGVWVLTLLVILAFAVAIYFATLRFPSDTQTSNPGTNLDPEESTLSIPEAAL